MLATAGTRILSRLDAINIPLLQSVRTDATALGFTLVAAILTGIVFGLAPAIQVRAGALHDALKDTSRGSTAGRGHNWIRSGLVVSEIAFACVLLVGAGLLIRSFVRVLDVNLGFRPERAAAVRVDPDAQYKTQAQQNAYFDEVLRRARETPVSKGRNDRRLAARPQSHLGSGRHRSDLPEGQYSDWHSSAS